jgi:hypothetical protein
VNAAINIPSSQLTWTNRDQTTIVSRTQPLTINFSGGPAGQSIQIIGGNTDLPTNSSALFYCIVPANATSFTVPAEVLSAIPPTRTNLLSSEGVIYVVSSTPAPMTASGLNVASATAAYMTGKSVIFH